jgi:hypothetical protein
MRKPIVSVSTLALGLLLGLGLGLGATSCTSKHKHCYFAEGDATCKAEFGEGYFCVAEGCDGYEQNIGCVTEMPSAECHAPNGMDDGMADGSSESASASSTEATTETTNPDTTATEATDAETTSSACTDDSGCDASMGMPFCVDGACVGCGEAEPTACMDANPSLPVCNEESGSCVQCLAGGNPSACEGTTPVCDAATNMCVGCKWHDECPDTACRMSTGECFPGPVIEATDASQLDEAIATIEAREPPIGVIHLQASNETNSVTVPAGMMVAILGEGPTSVWTGVNSTPALTIDGGAEVYVQRVRIAGTQGFPGGKGIVVNGELWLDRSEIINNAGGGLQIEGSAITRNSFVGGNAADVAAIDVQGGSATISFTTLGAGLGTAAGLLCSNGSTVTVTNSLLVARSNDDVVQCPNAAISHSALEQQQVGENVMLGALVTSWFADYANGDFHLSGTHPAEINTAASWQPGDPLVDIDGDLRPQDASPTAAGADLP